MDQEYPKRKGHPGPVRLKVSELRRGKAVQGVCFEARGGEILGLAGLVGAGRTELARLIFGADRSEAGIIQLDGRTLSLRSPAEAIAAGIGFLSEDRKLQGLITQHSVCSNFGLPNLDQFTRAGLLNLGQEEASFNQYAETMQLKRHGPKQRASHLSGGNQQKLVIAKWLARRCEVLIFDEPTRGIDVGAKYEIYQLMHALADEGKVILMISSELPEMLGMADRILVMHQGRLTGEITHPASSNQQAIMEMAVA
jgi:ABC-type sugar transport system ATPase subunit